MRNLDAYAMQFLSFPDFDVEKMEFCFSTRTVRISVEGAWLDMNGGVCLGKGVLCFNNWKILSVRRFNPHTKEWLPVGESSSEILTDICEMKIVAPYVTLCGFGKEVGHWMEWKIENANMHAIF